MFLPYLWGIETLIVEHRIRWLQTSFLPYLWGIETYSNVLSYAVNNVSFYPTYEALKHNSKK